MTTHSKQFYAKRFKELKQWAKTSGVTFPYRDRREFESDWIAIQSAGSKKVFSEIKYALKYNTGYNTALAEKRIIRELNLEDIKLSQLKKMTTTEFADRFKDQIMNSYQQAKRNGMTGAEAQRYVSEYWFGSN